MTVRVLADTFLKSDCDSVLFIDDDMCFDSDYVSRMRDDPATTGYDGVMALVLARRQGHRPLIINPLTTSEGQVLYRYRDNWPDYGIVDDTLLGLGFTLYKRQAFVKSGVKDGQYFRWSDTLGEDTGFANSVRNAGGKLAVNCNVKCGHRMRHIVYPGKDNVAECSINWKTGGR
jgi:hypothetical protein